MGSLVISNKLCKRLVVNSLFLGGKKNFGWNLFISLLCELKGQLGVMGWSVVFFGLINVVPLVGFSFVKLGGIRYRVPSFISLQNSLSFGVFWLFRERSGYSRPFFSHILRNVIASFFSNGVGIQRNLEWQEIASRNRVFMNFLI